MRVVHICPIFSELTQTFIYELVRNMEAYGVDTHVLTWRRRNREDRPFQAVHTVQPPGRAELARLRLNRTLPRPVENSLTLPTSFEREVAEQLRRLRPDLVHAHFGPTAVLIGRACRLAGVPMIVTFRGRDASAKLRKWRWRRLYRRTLAGAAAVASVSPDILARLAPVLPAGMETRVIFGGKRARDLPFRAPPPPRGRAISIGRLIEKKGHGDAIRAIARAREQGVPATLTIVGEGPLDEHLREEIQRLGLESAVSLAGSLPYHEVVQGLQDSDFLIAANRTAANGDREGIPNVVKEAQLIGLPIVATRHGGIPWALPEEARADLAEEGDVEGLARRLAELNHASVSDLARIAEAGRDYVLREFDPWTEVQRYLDLYERIAVQDPPVTDGVGWPPATTPQGDG